MNIKFLGTGASNWPDTLRGEKEYRRFSSMLADNKLLIDPGRHIFDFAKDFGYDDLFENVNSILLTHSHGDHLDIKNLQKLCDLKKRTIYCEQNAASAVRGIKNLEIRCILPFCPINADGYTITAVPANHATEIEGEQALHYIAQKDGKRFFYGCDGAWIRRDSWYYMRDFQYDLMVFDGTIGDSYGDYRIFEHNNLKMVELMSDTARNTNVIKSDGRILISHLAYGLHGTQKETEKRLENSCIGVAYDGLSIDI